MLRFALIVIGCLLMVLPGRSQSQTEVKSVFDVSLANDLFYFPNQTDRYFTNGTTFYFAHPSFNKWRLNKALFGWFDTDLNRVGFELTQNIYTPSNTSSGKVEDMDRPFASYLMLKYRTDVFHIERQFYFKYSVDVGVMGDPALGENVQNLVHAISPTSNYVLGWSHQLQKSFLVNLNLSYEHSLFNNRWFQLGALSNANFGNLNGEVSVGPKLYLGKSEQSLMQRKQSYYRNDKLEFLFESYFLVNGQWYDATLGNLLQQELNHFQYRGAIGVEVYYRNVVLGLTLIKESADATGLDSHAWGAMKFRYLF